MQALMQWVTAYVLNVAWQALVLAGCAWLLVRFTRRGGAQLHYWLWVGSLLLIVLLPAAPASGLHMPSLHWPHRSDAQVVAPQKSTAVGAVQDAPGEQIPIYMTEMVAPARTGIAGQMIVWAYLLTVVIALARLLREAWATRRVVRGSHVFILPEQLQIELQRVCSVMRVRSVAVRSSAELSSPATVSWPHAMLLVPEDFASCSAEDAAAAMGHELAHVRRHDFWVNLLCEVLAIAAWWHPAVHWVKRRIAETREVCCDELAAEVTRGRAAYARSLVSLAENALHGSGESLALGVSASVDKDE